jgi:hypothetical protein
MRTSISDSHSQSYIVLLAFVRAIKGGETGRPRRESDFLTEDKFLGGRQHVQREGDLASSDAEFAGVEWDKPHIGISSAAASEMSRRT